MPMHQARESVSEQQAGTLAGKVALVTGAGRGIGQAIAIAFAQEGADIAVHYRKSAEGAERTATEIRALGRRAEILRADVSVVAEGQRLVTETVERFGRLDILVNNAGTFDTTPLFHVTEERFDRVLATDFKGPYFLAQAAARQMVAQQGGTIINFASGVATDADPGYFVGTPYAGAKAALWRVSQRLAMELGEFGIRVNVIVPGFIHSKAGPLPEHVRARFAPLAALKRTGSVDDIARVALFLASDDARFITGQTFVVDGGMRMH
ncbi:MAG: SDR family NAD(P)-dependent oxidoreductase [Thermomicrobiales bacterium]